jgi:hypothetical protein
MKEPKKILLLVVIVILIASVAYLSYIMQDGSNPLLIFNTRASTNADDLLTDEGPLPTDDPGDAGSDPIVEESPTPTTEADSLAYLSTSPTVSPTVAVNPSISPTETATPSPTLVAEMTPTAIPTAVENLPVAGIGDHLPSVIIGGAALILLAFFL